MKSSPRLLVFFILSWLGCWVIIPAQAEGESRIALVVQFDDSNIVTKCVPFSGNQITGYEVLERSGLGLSVEFGSMGAVVCKIGETGCSENNCWCEFPPTYWSYWHLVDNSWSYSQLGASLYNVQNGSVEGWRWGEGEPPTANYTFDQICQPATSTPTASDTPVPTATEEQPTATTELINQEESTPFTIYLDTSSSDVTTPTATWTMAATLAISTDSTTPYPVVEMQGEIQNQTPTVEIIQNETPTVTPTQKIKAAQMKATRQAKKTQDSYQKTMESYPTPTAIPSQTQIPQTTPSDNQGMIKFLVVLVLLLIMASAGTWILRKRG